MRTILQTVMILAFSVHCMAQQYVSPLGEFSAKWNDAKYKVANTAGGAKYMSASEQQVIYLLNLVRMDPQLFCATVLKSEKIGSYTNTSSAAYYGTLVTKLKAMQPLGLLQPNQLCYASAECHATSSGKKGYTGHDRQTKECREKMHYHGECCSYGVSDPLAILVGLLVDEGVPSLGHRKICLGDYKDIGVAIKPHTGYGTTAVLDLY